MAAAAASTPSPAPSNNSSEAGAGATGVLSTSTVAALMRMETPSKTLRGLNKPKCIQCGNVARSRCPYQCCKSCCFKAQNPCHIHVLKLPPAPLEKPLASTPVSEQQPSEPPPPSSSHRQTRQPLQANAYKLLFSATRSKKPLTRKEAIAINEWRLSKLKERTEKMIEVENDAFDRYMKNVNALEELFSIESVEKSPLSTEKNMTEISRNKLKLRSNSSRQDNVRSRMKQIVDDGLKNLEKCERGNSTSEHNEPTEIIPTLKKARTLWVEASEALSELVDKLSRVRNEDDLKSCMELKAQIYHRRDSDFVKDIKEGAPDQNNDVEMNSISDRTDDSLPPKPMVTAQIDQEALNSISAYFGTLEKIGRL